MYQASKLSSPSELGDQGYQLKSVLACICIYYSIKSLEWGFLKGPIRFRSDENRVLRDNDKTNDVDGGMKSQKQSDWNLVEMIGWTFAQITSARGIGFDWGPPRPREMVSLKSLVWRMYKVKLAALFAINFAVANRDSSTRKPLQVFVERLGIPNFIGLNLIAESLLTISFALIVCCSMDNNYSVLILIMSQFHKFFKKFKFRKTIVDYFDPVNWPPIYDSPHLAESLTDFWGNRWHKLLRRTFLISGGKPLAFIYQKISGSSKSVQMACLLLGSFISSGITHEYILSMISQSNHSNPNRPSITSGSMIFFTAQAIGIIIESKVFPDQGLSGNHKKEKETDQKKLLRRDNNGISRKSLRLIKIIWVYCFLILSAHKFRQQYLESNRLESVLIRFSDLNWVHFLSPVL
ncbi:expressed protein [Phakopsora pachyrhizi]|uniref:Expressed protein n=1 Tax=Phakopsora pachyrhizi TaxID=170000 RepID=A0AAV0BNI6_PHAPC|nr:expressed protein [Phakopsora pachyrhizi]